MQGAAGSSPSRISTRYDGRRRAALHIHDFLEHGDPMEHPITATEVLKVLPPLPADRSQVA